MPVTVGALITALVLIGSAALALVLRGRDDDW